jgi:hypothetical protein
MQFEYTFAGVRRIGRASWADAAWSHGLKVEIRNEEGSLLNKILFAGNPEQPDFDQLQTKGTEELIDMVIQRLSSGELEATLREARQHGVGTLILNFSDAS